MEKPKTVQELIDFLKPFPAKQWCTHTRTDDNGNHCVLGFIDAHFRTDENDFDAAQLIEELIPDARPKAGNLEIVNINNSNPKNIKKKVMEYLKSKV